MRRGHIPGSKNLFFKDLLTPQNTIKEPEELRKILELYGVDEAREIVTTCGSGVTGALIYFALYLLGYRNVSLYDGAWSEYGSRPFEPVN